MSPEAPAAKDGAPLEREAKLEFELGLQLLREERWDDSEQAFRRSLAFMPRDSTKYDLAYVLYKRGRISQSLSILKPLTELPGVDARYREYAEALMPHVVSQLARLRIVAAPAESRLTIDGQTIADTGPNRDVAIDPGPHVAELSAPGTVPQRFSFTAPPGGTIDRSVVLSPLDTPSPSSPAPRPVEGARPPSSSVHTYAPWIVMGVGGALLVGGVVTGIFAKRADDDFTEGCPSLRDCSPALKETRDRALSLGRASDILLVSGGVIAAGGIGWKILAPEPAAPRGSNRTYFVAISGAF
jgi:hypothetical protein